LGCWHLGLLTPLVYRHSWLATHVPPRAPCARTHEACRPVVQSRALGCGCWEVWVGRGVEVWSWWVGKSTFLSSSVPFSLSLSLVPPSLSLPPSHSLFLLPYSPTFSSPNGPHDLQCMPDDTCMISCFNSLFLLKFRHIHALK
jgi:hypothetical protein